VTDAPNALPRMAVPSGDAALTRFGPELVAEIFSDVIAYCAIQPPSTTSDVAVVNLASSEQR
jgi:hypothetical protein